MPRSKTPEGKAKRRAYEHKHAAELAAKKAERYRYDHPNARPYAPKPPRGPSDPAPVIPSLHNGHELSGVSTLTGPGGELKATWNKTRVAGADPGPLPEGFSSTPVRVSRMSRGDGQKVIEWASYEPQQEEREQAIRDAWERHASLYAGLAGTTDKPAHTNDDLITLYNLGDPHIGMLAWAPETGDHFDAKIACRELLACVRELVACAPPSTYAEVDNLGDFLHAQDDMARTPGHGHPLDTDGRYPKILDAGHALLRGVVDCALAKHAFVTERNLPGNHDPRVAAELMFWLRAVYEQEPRVTVADAYAAHQYREFGKNLFGWHHGDGTPIVELPAIMAVDQAEAWGRTLFHWWHTGHIHHLTRKETPGCVVESHRTMAARDGWHAKRYRAGRSLSAITYHREYGEVSRVTVDLSRVRALKGIRP